MTAHPQTSSLFPQGRRVAIFDLSFTAKWEGKLLDARGKTLGTGDGEIIVTDLDQSCFAVDANGAAELDFPLRVEAADDGGAADTALADIIKASIAPLLRARLAALVAELRYCE